MVDPSALLHFQDPNQADVPNKVTSLLEGLEKSSILTSLRIGRLWQRPTFKAATAIGMARHIVQLLEKDCRENIIETQNEEWSFDYVICRDWRDQKVLQFLTRLFHPTRGDGDIFYGRYVRKTLMGTYIMWADD